MVCGTIQDFYTAAKGAEKSVVKFLVRNEADERDDTCTVCAEIPNDALKYKMVRTGSPIGWQEKKVFIEIEGVEDVPFNKVGTSGGDEVTFYEHLKSLDTFQEGRK
jgi:hypothetical protein